MRELFDPGDPRVAGVHKEYLDLARATNRQILKITWDAEEGWYHEHAWGFTQYSVRPYRQWYGCDGTTDDCIHFIARDVCKRLDLDYADLYEQAYNRECDARPGESWLRFWSEEAQARTAKETILPGTITDLVLCGVLNDLTEINNRSLVTVLGGRFTRLGFVVADWWTRKPTFFYELDVSENFTYDGDDGYTKIVPQVCAGVESCSKCGTPSGKLLNAVDEFGNRAHFCAFDEVERIGDFEEKE